MAETDLTLEFAPPVAVLTLNRPDKRNALSQAMWAALPGLLAQAADRPDIRVLIVTGAGKAFAAGADISEFETVYATPASQKAYTGLVAAAVDALEAFPKPSIAKIRGACVGGGCALALACDLRFAEPGAKFGITPAKLGLIYSLNDTRRLVQAVGLSRAKDLLYTGRLISAEEAMAIGLIDHVIHDPRLDQAVTDHGTLIARNSGFSTRATKEILQTIALGQMSESQATLDLFLDAFGHQDFKEGYDAFLNKRPPHFS